jgi:hypothetical protein|nr:MAG TPA: hypothetical protein [Caudoviricetes sp.]
MTDKDPKDFTASEQLRWAANGEPYNGIDESIWTYPTGKIKALAEAVTGEWPSDNEIFSIVADKIDAELAQARRSGLERAAKSWAKANGWPDFREGEDFGAWLDRCAFAKPIDDCGEPVRFGEHYGNMEQWLYSVSFCGRHAVLCGSAGEEMRVESGERVKRRVPEALGADGLPIKAGETVYRLSDGERLEVLLPHGSTPETREYVDCCGELELPSNLTHERPVLGADGKPIVSGDTVWGILSGSKGIVNSLNDDSTAYVEWDDERFSPCIDCCNLTHTPPETQERIDDDATMPPAEYCAAYGIDLGDDPDRETATRAMIADLLRRQREYDKRTGGDA